MIVILLVKLLVINKILLKEGQFVFPVKRGTGAAPQKPHKVLGKSIFSGKIRLVHQHIDLVQQCLPAETLTFYFHALKSAVFVHGNTAVEHQITVADLIHGTLGQQKTDMPPQFLAVPEGVGEYGHQFLLRLRKPHGTVRVHRGKSAVPESVYPLANLHRPAAEIHSGKQIPLPHLPLRMGMDQLGLQLQLDHRDGLMHLSRQVSVDRIINIVVIGMGIIQRTGIVAVHLPGKNGKGPHIQSVAVLQQVKIVVLDGNPDHIGDKSSVAGGCPDPGNIMVAPLNIHIVHVHQFVQNDIRPGPPVKDISDDVQLVNGQRLDQMAEGDNEGLRNSRLNNGSNDIVIIALLVHILGHVQQFIHYVAQFPRNPLPHPGSGVLGGNGLADQDQPVDCQPAPLIGQLTLLPETLDLPLRIIDQAGQSLSLGSRHGLPQHQVNLALDHAGRALKHMQESLILPMEVAEKIFRALGQASDGREVDDLAGRALYRGKFFCKQL